MANKSSGFFRFWVGLLLLGIFVELLFFIAIFKGVYDPKGNVAVVDVVGPISASREIVQNLKKYEKQEDVKAIVVRVNSPGGTVGASQEIYEEILRIKENKKVVVSMGDVAASGGYYIAAAAEKIVANKGTITGSIGVIASYFIIDDFLKRFDLKWEVLKAGEVKDIGSSLKDLNPQERQILETLITDSHEQFMQDIAKGRNMPIEEVRKVADGRVISGTRALEAKLVDELGGLEHAIRVAAKLAGIKPKNIDTIYPKKEKGLLKELTGAVGHMRSLLQVSYKLNL